MTAVGSELLVEQDGGITRLTFNRPWAMNSFGPRMVEGLGEALRKFRQDPGARVLVITGSGRAFCCGADLKYLRQHLSDPETVDAYLEELNSFLDALAQLPQPVIAEVNGIALGGGLETILACDLAVAAESVLISDQHINRDFLPGAGSSQRLPRAIGPRLALDLLLTGRRISAHEAQAMGIVSIVVPDDALRSTVDALARRLAERSARALAEIKRLVYEGLTTDLATGLRLERAALLRHMASPEFLKGLDAFADPEKRRECGDSAPRSPGRGWAAEERA